MDTKWRGLLILVALSVYSSCTRTSSEKDAVASQKQVTPIVAIDPFDRQLLQKKNPRILEKIEAGERLSIDDIKKMSRVGLSDQTIIWQIKSCKAVFLLSTADIIHLRQAGVSQRVVDAMIQTGNQ